MSRLGDHYEAVRNRHGSDRVEFDLGPLSAAALRRRFVAVDGRAAVARALERPTMVSTGVGMTGPPHLGTVGQILTAIELQKAGLPVQFVIADLEPYHGGADADYVFDLAERYRSFVLDLGFDPDHGVLRTQDEAHGVMHTGHRLARYYAPDEWDDGDSDPDPTDWERAVREAYERDGVDRGESGPSSDAAGAHSGVLHGADFLHPLSEWDYDQVIVMLGIDEHGLTPWTRRFLDATSVEGTVAGLHTRMLPGFDGMPKMSKSIPGSGIALDAAPETIRDRILRDEGGDAAASPVFQSMCLASRYDPERLDRLERACENGGAAWRDAKREYAEYVVELAEQWQATGV